ncbi:MAG: TPM domain-containing protein [Planctomycetaceae bacterium]
MTADIKRALILASIVVLLMTAPCSAAPPIQRVPAERFHIDLAPPEPRQFILDKADMIGADDEEAIRQIADKLLTDKVTPIIVVTINSMSEHGGGGLTIETFARLLFDQWGIGYAELQKKEWNTGILLLVSKNDRKARIELGAGWKHGKDEQCQKIMNELIVPRFKQGEFSAGIRAGALALDKMARDLALPSAPRPWWHAVVAGVAIALLIFTVVSLIRRGNGGWAWLMWGIVFAVIGTILYQVITNAGRSGGGGSFSGGSFGGGSSGGGGASGSW